MICKIQVSLFGNPATLIYNEDKSFMVQETRAMGEKCLGDELKGYFKCSFKKGILHIYNRVEDKAW